MSKLGALVRRLGLDNVPLHATATAESLALARILMLAIWIVYVVQDPVQSLTFLPQELFHAFGVFQLVPGTAWAALLTPTGLFALKSVLIGLFAWAMFGFRGWSIMNTNGTSVYRLNSESLAGATYLPANDTSLPFKWTGVMGAGGPRAGGRECAVQA